MKVIKVNPFANTDFDLMIYFYIYFRFILFLAVFLVYII